MASEDPLAFADVRLDVAAVLDALDGHGVRAVLVGGMAALLHGSALPTEDIDITPDPAADNLDRLADALRSLGAQWRVEGLDHGFPPPAPLRGGDLAGKLSAAFVTRAGFIDVVLVHSDGATWDRLSSNAVVFDVYGHRVLVSAIEDMVASKEAAARPKDDRALAFLRELLRRRRPGA